MSIAHVVFRRCLRHIARASPLLLVCVLGAAFSDPAVAGTWIHVACFALAAVACASAFDSWPPFARDRAGALARLPAGPLGGCGAAALAALAALALGLAALGAVVALAAAVVPAPRAHVQPVATDPPVLLMPGRTATFRWTDPVACHELQLRPIAILPPDASPQPVTLAVQAGGLEPALVTVAGTSELSRIPLHGAVVDEVRLEHREGNLPLVFPAGSLAAVASATQPRTANGALAALALLPAAAIAIGTAMALGSLLAPAVGLALTLSVLLVLTLGDLTPAADAVVAMLRGRWLPAEPIWPGLAQATCVACALTLPAVLLRRRVSR